jgi:ribosomal protein S18 acetylase RimI-like enzyme
MTLRPMEPSDYAIWMPRLRREYINDKIRANGYTLVEATKVGDESFARLLPEGLSTQNHFFFVAQDQSQTVGYAWIHTRPIGGEIQSYIYDVVVEEEARGKGFGRKLMLALETKSKELGASRLALHVFGFNERAIKLYQSLGFETTDLSMEKRL